MPETDSLRVPQIVTGVDARALPLVPEDAFVLGCIDGVADIESIVAASGMPAERVAQSLQKLRELGAIRYSAGQETNRPSAVPRDQTSSRPRGPHAAPRMRAAVESSAGPIHDPTELEEEVDIDRELRRKILDIHQQLEKLTHYELLGVGAEADRKAVKDAYYGVVTLFHPDRYFGKHLGSYKPKLERVFRQLTQAHDTLSRQTSRETYDAELAAKGRAKVSDEHRRSARAPRSSEPTSQGHAQSTDGAERRRESQRTAEAPSALTGAIPRPPPVPQSVITPEAPRSDAARSQGPVSQSDPAFRRNLARKLGHSRTDVAAASVRPPPSVDAARAAADSGLRRHLSRKRPGLSGVELHLARAAEQAEQGHLASAVNLLKIALVEEPGSAELRKRLEEFEQRLHAEQAGALLEQALQAERAGQAKSAALAYARAAHGRSDAALYNKAAECLLAASLELRTAGDYAREAVQRAPDRTPFRITLARVYAAAGMRNSALAELERAETLAPNDDTIKTWLSRIRRGES